jgi:predicted AlkP superfamily pyrophosphatase or phosphodiesterase
MSPSRSFLLALLLVLPVLGAPRPKLVVVVSVDQLSADLIARWGQDLPGGVGQLLREGTHFTAAFQEHGYTETGPGHSTLLSGRHPAHTGISENRWLDPATGKLIYCVEDPSVQTLGLAAGKPGSGPKWFQGGTLAGWMRDQLPGSRAFVLSGKDRSAILMAGPKADGVFWFESGVGFTTSTAYSSRLPGWLEAHNRAFLARVEETPLVWTASSPLVDLVRAGRYELPGRILATGLPRAIRGIGMPLDEPFWTRFRTSPFFDSAIMDAAESLLEQEALGKGPAPDLLAVGLSATDYIGHSYGNAGPEMRDQLLRLDGRLGQFLARVRQRDPGAWIVLSADHGCTDFCERLKEQGYPAQRLLFRPWLARVEEGLDTQLGAKGPFLQGTDTPQLWLREENVKASGKTREQVLAVALATVKAQPEIAAAFSAGELDRLALDPAELPGKRSLAARLKLSYVPGRSGDILAALKPFITFDEPPYAVNHGSAWDYDRRIPLVFLGPWAAEKRAEPVRTVDLAPTLVKELGLKLQEPVDGRALELKAK